MILSAIKRLLWRKEPPIKQRTIMLSGEIGMMINGQLQYCSICAVFASEEEVVAYIWRALESGAGHFTDEAAVNRLLASCSLKGEDL